MVTDLQVLVVEDSADDAALLLAALKREAYEPLSLRVDTPEAMQAALDEKSWDLILCDYFMPRFSAPAALELLKETGLDVPFIIVSGRVGEEAAVAAMKSGAHDYLVKGNLGRLGAVVERELTEAQMRRERMEAQERVITYQAGLRSLTAALAVTAERERRLLANELHDSVAQSLAICKMKLTGLREKIASTDAVAELGVVGQVLQEAIRDTRSLIFDLSPPLLYEVGFGAAASWLAGRTEARHGITVKVAHADELEQLDEDISVALFQSLRELLINTVKHAQADRIDVSMRRDGDWARVTVDDNGIGFDPSKLREPSDDSGGFGLLSIRERMSYLGGELNLESELGKGTRATLVVPLERGDQHANRR